MLKFNSFSRKLLQIFSIAFTFILIYILSIIIFRVNNGRIDQFSLGGVTPLKVIIGIIIELSFFVGITLLINKINPKYLKYISIFTLSIVAILTIVFGFGLITNPQWDFGTVYREAAHRALYGGKYLSPYFYKMYPNNIFITLILSWIYKFFTLFNIHSFDKLSVGINIIFIMASVIATYFLIKDMYGSKIATASSFLFIFLTPIYAYAPIFYTDTFTLMYLPLIYLLYRKYIKSNSWIYLILMGILGAIGVSIKNNIAIGIIALFIFAILSLKNYKKFFKFLILFGISFGLVFTCINAVCQSNIPIPMKEAGFPATNWLMMGLNSQSNGSWSTQDFEKTLSLVPNKQAMETMNLKVIEERLDNLGPIGYIQFLNKKAGFVWQSGDLFAVNTINLGTKNTDTTLYKYVLGNKQGGFLLFSQVGFGVLIILVLLGNILSLKDNDLTFVLFNITIFGVFVFLLLWEAESRYILCILPVIIASSSSGLSKLSKVLIKK
ncbi:MAG: ArnT family glycosyltransferase [Clostridium sp.]